MKRNTIVQPQDGLYGLNIYRDKKGRTIYHHPFMKQAYYVPTYDIKTFQIYRMRFVIGASAYIVLQAILADFYELSWTLPLGIAAILFLAIEWKFFRFIKGMQTVKQFHKEDCVGYFDILARQDQNKILLKTLAYLALGILLILNAYQKSYSGFILVFSWGAGILCMGYAILQLIALKKAKTH